MLHVGHKDLAHFHQCTCIHGNRKTGADLQIIRKDFGHFIQLVLVVGVSKSKLAAYVAIACVEKQMIAFAIVGTLVFAFTHV